MLLCLEVLNFALCLHPPNRCVFVRGCLHFFHSIGPALCFPLHRYSCVPHATSYKFRLHMYGDCERACMLKSVPDSLAFLSNSPNMPLDVV